MSNINLLFFRMTKASPLVNEIANHYSYNKNYDVSFYEDEKETINFFSNSPKGVFFFTVNSKEELKAAIRVLRAHKKEIIKGLIKPTCILTRSSRKIEQILGKYNCNEILAADIRPESAVFKIDFWSKQILLQTQRHQSEIAKEIEEEKVSSIVRNTPKSDIVSIDALEHESDIWLIKNQSDTKKILRRWLLRVVGPSPKVCKWEEVESTSNKAQKTWKLKFISDEIEFYSSKGHWLFEGARPEFDWKMKRWNFSSDNPHLYFKAKEGAAPLSRFRLNTSNLEVCENSTSAQEKEDQIIKTFDTSYSFKLKKEVQSETSLKSEENEDAGNLEGEFKDNKKESSHMRGNGKETEKENTFKKGSFKEDSRGGHLKGSVRDKNNNQSERDAKDNEHNNGAANKENNGEKEHHGGHLQGQVKSSTEKLKTEKDKKDLENKETENKSKKNQVLAELLNKEKDVEAIDSSSKTQTSTKKVQAKAEQERAQKEKNSLNAETEKTKKTNTNTFKDKERSKPDFSNKAGPEKEKRERQRGEFDDTQSGNLGGKSSTDKINNAPMRSKIHKSVENEKKERQKGDYQSESLNDMNGKSQTDQVDRSALNGKIKKHVETDNKNKENKKPLEDSIDDQEAKSSTDQTDPNPLTPKLQKEIEQEQDNKKSNYSEEAHSDLDGEGSTDEIDRSHYSNQQSIDHQKEKAEREALVAAAQKDRSYRKKEKQVPIYGRDEYFADEESEVNYGSVRTPDMDREDNDFGKSQEESFEDALNPKLDFGEEDEVAIDESNERENLKLATLLSKPVEVNTESGRLYVSIEQSTTAGNAITFLCDFEDFYPDELSVQAPKDSLSVGDLVSAKVSLKYNSSRKEVIVKGKITDVESFDDKQDHLVINIERINKSDYEQFISLYSDRQDQIMEFMQKAKGF